MDLGDEKYVVFKRQELLDVLNEWVAPQIREAALTLALNDAVVIRRQDFFASPALGVYANCVAMVSKTTQDEVLAKRLLGVADYFHQQSELAADEGFKFPD